MTTFGPYHSWPAPLLAQTTFFDHTVLCPNLCELDPKKPWPKGLLFGICYSCLFGEPWTSLHPQHLSAKPPTPRPPWTHRCVVGCVVVVALRCVVWCGVVVCVVVWCVGVVCDQDFRVRPRSGRSPPPDPFFFPLPPQFSFFLPSLGGLLVEFCWCF